MARKPAHIDAAVRSPITQQDQRRLRLPVTSITGPGALGVAQGGTGTTTAFPDGSVVHAGAAGVYTSDVKLVWDRTNKRLGLGTNAPANDVELRVDALGALPFTPASATPLRGLRLANTTAATLATPVQAPPGIEFAGQAWDLDNAVTRPVRYGLYYVPLSANTTSGFLALRRDEGAGGGWNAGGDDIRIGSVLAGDVPSLRFADGNIVFRNASRGIYFTAAPLTDSTASTPCVLSGDVLAATFNRLKSTVVGGYFYVEGNNSGFGAGTVPSIDIRNFDQSTLSPIVSIRHRGTPFGAPAAGFGTRQLHQANSSTTADQDQGAVDVIWTDPTHATRSAAFRVQLVNGAAALATKLQVQPAGLIVLGAPGAGVPALKPVAAVLEARLGDDSARAQVNAELLALTDGITAPAATAGLAKIYVDTADGDLKVIFGDGTVQTIVTD